MHLAVALDGAGWHPAAWREPAARPAELFTARYWADLVVEAERGLLDLVTFEDAFSLQPGGVDRVRGRLDAVLVAARVAPLTRHVGLVPTVVATHTEPFHIAKAIATLDYVSKGRAGVRVDPSADPADNGHVGRRSLDHDLRAEAADHVEVLRRLWDSWEDDAEIRDAATGRFIDRDKLHYIDFEGPFFSVKGPSITPRPPQGQPLVASLAPHLPGTDLVFVTPQDADHAAALVAELPGGTLAFGDLPFSDGTAEALADVVVDWHRAGLHGVRLLPAALPADLTAITRGLVPELQRRGLFRTSYEADTLRGLLGLAKPDNRYAGTVAS